MRNPNGYGSIKKLSGNRRRPYIFVISQAGKQRIIGYYATHVEALIAQTDYNIHHARPRLSDNKMSFSPVPPWLNPEQNNTNINRRIAYCKRYRC